MPAGLAASVTAAAAGASAGTWLTILAVSKIKSGILGALVAVAAAGVGGILWAKRGTESQLPVIADRREPGAAPQERPEPAPTPGVKTAAQPPAPGKVDVANGAETEQLLTMTPVEKLVNAGRVTPVAAVQTFIWAALNGADDELAAALALDKSAREKAEAWRAALPAESQARYATVEKLPGLFLAEEIVRKAAAVQVLDANDNGTGLVTVRARTANLSGKVSTSNFPMQLGPDGWRLIIPNDMIDGMRRSAERKGGMKTGNNGVTGR